MKENKRNGSYYNVEDIFWGVRIQGLLEGSIPSFLA